MRQVNLIFNSTACTCLSAALERASLDSATNGLSAVSQDGAQESKFFRELKAARPFFVMAGPNVVQSEEHALKLARQIKAITDRLGLLLVFKSSFDKANRTSAASFRGPGLTEGLRCAFPRSCATMLER